MLNIDVFITCCETFRSFILDVESDLSKVDKITIFSLYLMSTQTSLVKYKVSAAKPNMFVYLHSVTLTVHEGISDNQSFICRSLRSPFMSSI